MLTNTVYSKTTKTYECGNIKQRCKHIGTDHSFAVRGFGHADKVQELRKLKEIIPKLNGIGDNQNDGGQVTRHIVNIERDRPNSALGIASRRQRVLDGLVDLEGTADEQKQCRHPYRHRLLEAIRENRRRRVPSFSLVLEILNKPIVVYMLQKQTFLNLPKSILGGKVQP